MLPFFLLPIRFPASLPIPPHYALHGRPPTSSSAPTRVSRGFPTLPCRAAPDSSQVSVWDAIHLNLYTRSRVPSVFSPKQVSTFPNLRFTRRTDYSSRIQNVTFVYAPAPPFKYPQGPISESFVRRWAARRTGSCSLPAALHGHVTPADAVVLLPALRPLAGAGFPTSSSKGRIPQLLVA